MGRVEWEGGMGRVEWGRLNGEGGMGRVGWGG